VLQERIVDAQSRNAAPGEVVGTEVAQEKMLESLEGTLKIVTPMLGMVTSAREMLAANWREAESQDDPATFADATQLLEELSAHSDDLQRVIAELQARAHRLRESMASRSEECESNEAG